MKTKILLLIILALLGILVSIYNTKISWVVSDYYYSDTECIKDTYRVKVKLGDYWLFGENCPEEYENIGGEK